MFWFFIVSSIFSGDCVGSPTHLRCDLVSVTSQLLIQASPTWQGAAPPLVSPPPLCHNITSALIPGYPICSTWCVRDPRCSPQLLSTLHSKLARVLTGIPGVGWLQRESVLSIITIVRTLLWSWETGGVWVPPPLKGVIIAIVIIGSPIISWLPTSTWGFGAGEARNLGLSRLANTFLIGPTRSWLPLFRCYPISSLNTRSQPTVVPRHFASIQLGLSPDFSNGICVNSDLWAWDRFLKLSQS